MNKEIDWDKQCEDVDFYSRNNFYKLMGEILYVKSSCGWVLSNLTTYELKESSDYKKRPAKQEVKPVYTKEMHKIGSIPVVGSFFIVSDLCNSSRVNDFDNKEVKVLAITQHEKDKVITFYHEGLGLGCGTFCKGWVNPIHIKTDKEKLKESIIRFESEFHDRTDYYDLLVDKMIRGEFHKIKFTGSK